MDVVGTAAAVAAFLGGVDCRRAQGKACFYFKSSSVFAEADFISNVSLSSKAQLTKSNKNNNNGQWAPIKFKCHKNVIVNMHLSNDSQFSI